MSKMNEISASIDRAYATYVDSMKQLSIALEDVADVVHDIMDGYYEQFGLNIEVDEDNNVIEGNYTIKLYIDREVVNDSQEVIDLADTLLNLVEKIYSPPFVAVEVFEEDIEEE